MGKIEKKVINIIEITFYAISILAALGFFGWCIVEIFTEINNWQKIASFAAISAVSTTIYIFISNNKMKRLECSIKLVEDFDREDFRGARNLTRAIGKIKDEISSNNLIKLIDNNFKDDNEADEILKEFKITKDNCKKLEESVIFTFNYWERVASALKYNVVKDEYIKAHLSRVYISQYKRFKSWLEKKLDKEMFDTLEELYDTFKAYVDKKDKK